MDLSKIKSAKELPLDSHIRLNLNDEVWQEYRALCALQGLSAVAQLRNFMLVIVQQAQHEDNAKLDRDRKAREEAGIKVAVG